VLSHVAVRLSDTIDENSPSSADTLLGPFHWTSLAGRGHNLDAGGLPHLRRNRRLLQRRTVAEQSIRGTPTADQLEFFQAG